MAVLDHKPETKDSLVVPPRDEIFDKGERGWLMMTLNHLVTFFSRTTHSPHPPPCRSLLQLSSNYYVPDIFPMLGPPDPHPPLLPKI